MISFIIHVFFIKIQPNMSEQEKKRQRVYLLNAEIKPKLKFPNNQSFFVVLIKPRPEPHHYSTWGASENKTNATSHPIIGLLKTAIQEEWNEISEEFILKACKSFHCCIDTIIEKNVGCHIE